METAAELNIPRGASPEIPNAGVIPEIPNAGVSPEAPPRGVSPEILVNQVRNTAPFFEDPGLGPDAEKHRYLQVLRGHAIQPPAPEALSHVEYYELCVSAHWATVATFVPTDVDNQIRFKLWHPALPTEALEAMAQAVLRARDWDELPVSRRFARSPETGLHLSGHHGEWFSIAVGAYGALRRRSPELAAEVGAAITRELDREAGILRDLAKARDGIGLLKCATLIAHNLGDLDRVFEMWNIPESDALAQSVLKLGHTGDSRFAGIFFQAGEFNKKHMAVESHRNFALRSQKPLRRSLELLLPLNPFLDEWGTIVARHPALSPEEVGQIVEALVHGFERLQKPEGGPIGYARAIAGIEAAFPGGARALERYLPAKVARILRAGGFRSLISVPRERFERTWNQIALKAWT